MRVDLFIEHYPNPYKPWIDTQLVQMLRDGHDVRIFAEGAYTSTLHDEVRQYRLQERTGYFPSTLRGLKRTGGTALANLVRAPFQQCARVVASAGTGRSPKQRLLDGARALCLPLDPPDVCYIHNLATASHLTFLHRLYPRTRVCLYFHGGEVGGQPRVRAEEAVFAGADAVVTSTRFAAEQAVARGCDPARIAVLPLGFDLEAYAQPTDRGYRPDGPVRFISVGRMSPEKGFRHALAAVKLLLEAGERDFTYTFVGSGIEFAELKNMSEREGLNRFVTFAGERTRTEVAARLAQADVFVLPSIATELWAETQATVVQEALLMGCLTITTTAGGVPESNAPEMARFSVPPADPASLAAAMRTTLSLTGKEMAELARGGRRFAERRYDIGPLMRRILQHASGGLPPDDEARYVLPGTD